jgi:hypothetical protein
VGGDGEPSWFGLEGLQHPFRWTRVRDVTWRLSLAQARPLRVRLQIPIVNQVVPDFCKDCMIIVDGEEWRSRLEDGKLVAEGTVNQAEETTITLRTPPLLSPSELRESPDLRRLGLAIAAA